MSNLVLSVRKALNKIIVGTSRIFYSFDKNISGVKKSRVTNVPNYEKDINFQIFYPTNFAERKLPTLYYFHGGGWIEYDKTIYNTLCKRFAKMGNIVVNVDYPLAPEYKMQELLEGCINIINFAQCITKEQFNADNDIIIGGDSAGAQIAGLFGGLEATGKFGDLFNEYTLPKISSLLLFYGVYDFENVLETKREAKIVKQFDPTIDCYTTPKGEHCKCYMYIAIDLGKSDNTSTDTHTTIWLNIDEVENKLTYERTKYYWNLVKDNIKSLL